MKPCGKPIYTECSMIGVYVDDEITPITFTVHTGEAFVHTRLTPEQAVELRANLSQALEALA